MRVSHGRGSEAEKRGRYGGGSGVWGGGGGGFFFNETAITEIYTLSLHDALPIYMPVAFPCLLLAYIPVACLAFCLPICLLLMLNFVYLHRILAQGRL